jgi:hypothetical protein
MRSRGGKAVVCADAAPEVDEPDDMYEDLQFWDGELPVRARVFTAGSVALEDFVRAAVVHDGLEECATEGLKDGEVEVGCALPRPSMVLPVRVNAPVERKEGMHMKPLHAPIVKRGRVYSFGGVEGWPEEVPQSVREEVASASAEGVPDEDVVMEAAGKQDGENEDVAMEAAGKQDGANDDGSATESFDCKAAKLKFEGILAKRAGEALQDGVTPSARVA